MSASLRFHLLGGAAIFEGVEPLNDLRSRTAEALLIYLACHERPISRQILADFFWDERSEQQAAANLRSILSMLRKQVGSYLIATRQTLAFDHDQEHWLDAAIFESRMRAIEPLLNSASILNNDNFHQLKSTLDLYQGEFLRGFHLSESRGFEEWLLVTRERLRRLAVVGLRRLVHHYLANGLYQPGILYAGRLIAADPYNEEARRSQMWLLVRSGQRNAALQSYLAFQQLLAEELSVEPSATTTAVYEQIKALTFPPPHKLPGQATPFIGREEETEALQQLLARPDGRLISIVGPGGAGKTRLAIQAAQMIATHQPGLFLNGIWFVPLSSVLSSRFLVTAIANVLDLALRGPTTPGEQLLAYLQNRELLLVLDNFEHLLAREEEGAALISDILRAAPQVKVLVTTREQLHLQEERIFDIEGLPYPKESGPVGHTAEAYSAVRLFMQCAQRVSRRFTAGEPEVEAVVELCRLLEGMPLGLEMAAAWARENTVDQILSQLRQNVIILETSWQNVPRRHRSLRAVFDHSWHLLTSKEQAAFARLSIFQGGFTVEAALAVSAGVHPAPFLDKSLLRKTEPDRYDMHSLVGQFAAEKLQSNPDSYLAVQNDHGRYYLELLRRQKEQLSGGRQQEVLNLIGREIDNIRRAWQWAIAEKESRLLDQAYFPLYLFYATAGWFEEGERLFSEAAAALETTGTPGSQVNEAEMLVYGRLLLRQSWFTYQSGKFVAAQMLGRQCEALFRRLEAEEDLAQSLNDLGVFFRRTGDYELARQFYEESLAIRRAIDDRQGLPATLINLANAIRLLGDYEQAREYLLESLELLEDQSNPILFANAHNDLGEIARALGNYEEARRYYEESLAIRRTIGARPGIADCLNNLGSVAHAQGDYEVARQYAQESLELYTGIGGWRSLSYPLSVLGRIARDEADFSDSLSFFKRALRVCQEVAYVPKALDVIFELSTVLQKMDKPEQAIRLLAFVIHHPKINSETASAAQELLNELASKVPSQTAESAQSLGQNDTLDHLTDAILKNEIF